MVNTPVYAEAEEVMDLVRDPSKQPGKDYVIVDVRGEDYKVRTKQTPNLNMKTDSSTSIGWSYSWGH